MHALLLYLVKNRAGTRTGRATWVYFAIWAMVLVANDVLVHQLHILAISETEPAVMWFALLSPAILLLNRFDRSGPTLQEAEEAARARAAAQSARDLATRDTTIAFRLGHWIRRRRG